MKTQLAGVAVSLTVHAFAVILLFNISHGLSPLTKTLVLDLSLESVGPIGKTNAEKEGTHPPKDLSTSGTTARSNNENPSLPSKTAATELPPIFPKQQSLTSPEQQSVKHDPPTELKALDQKRPKPMRQLPPLPPDLTKSEKLKKAPTPLREEKNPNTQSKQMTSATRALNTRTTLPEKIPKKHLMKPVSANSSNVKEITQTNWKRLYADRLGSPKKKSENSLPKKLAGPPGSGPNDLSSNTGATSPGKAGSIRKDTYLNGQFSIIRQRLRESLHYPNIARQRGWFGKVLIAFTIYPDGHVDQLEIKKSCGISLLDKSALVTVRNACPFPKPPLAIRIKLPILYQLN